LAELEKQEFVRPLADPLERKTLINNATQKALERFDETLRELALLRYQEFEAELSPLLTRFAVEETIRRLHDQGDLHWPQGIEEQAQVVGLTERLTPVYGHWLAKNPALEDLVQLTQDVARELHTLGALDDVARALGVKESFVRQLLSFVAEALGSDRKTLPGELLEELSAQRIDLWRKQVASINWELFDRGIEAFTWAAIEELVKGAKGMNLLERAPRGLEAD